MVTDAGQTRHTVPRASVSVAVFQCAREPRVPSHVLVVQRGKEPRKGQWSFPGGAVELGERIEQAARREVLEETGVSLLEVGSPFYATSAIFPPTYHYTIVHILALARAEAVAAAASDAADAKFVPIEEVSALRPQLDRLQAVLQRALAAWRDPLWAPSLEGPRE